MADKLLNRQLKIVGISCGILGDEVRLRRFYGERLAEAGLAAAALPPVLSAMAAGYAACYAKKMDGLVLSGGGDIAPRLWGEQPYIADYQADIARDEWELALCREFLAAGKPVLGICRGMQALNIALGGDIWQDLGAGSYHQQPGAPEEYAHPVYLTGRLRGIIGNNNIFVNSLHHQGVRRLGQGLQAAAYAPDGLVEAVCLARDRKQWACGVQWHPERLTDKASEKLWREFARAVGG